MPEGLTKYSIKSEVVGTRRGPSAVWIEVASAPAAANASTPPVTTPAGLGRVEAFSDGVLAIAITLLVLELQIPSGLSEIELLSALRGQGPQLFSFVLSFLVIGQFWVSHHRMFSHLTGYDDRLLVHNLVFLLSVVFLPFPTALLGEYMHYRSALLLYAGSGALAGTLFTVL